VLFPTALLAALALGLGLKPFEELVGFTGGSGPADRQRPVFLVRVGGALPVAWRKKFSGLLITACGCGPAGRRLAGLVLQLGVARIWQAGSGSWPVAAGWFPEPVYVLGPACRAYWIFPRLQAPIHGAAAITIWAGLVSL